MSKHSLAHTHILKTLFIPVYFSIVLPTTEAFSFSLFGYNVISLAPTRVGPPVPYRMCAHNHFTTIRKSVQFEIKFAITFYNVVFSPFLSLKIPGWNWKKQQQRSKNDLKLSPNKNHWNGNNCTYWLNYYIEFSQMCAFVCLLDCNTVCVLSVLKSKNA